MAHSKVKVNHALNLLSNLERMKNRKIASDFEIRVNEKSFSVHRTVLIATCPYFERLFSSNMKEVQEGFIVMKEVSTEGIECCLGFLYTGEVQITSSNVQPILRASHLLQIDSLTQICLQHMRDNLSVETCLLSLKLFTLYGTTEDRSWTEQYVTNHFTEVTRTNSFPQISKEDLKRYLKAFYLHPEIRWQAIVWWLSTNEGETERVLPDLVGILLEKRDIKMDFLIGTVWKDPFVQSNVSVKSLILNVVSRNGETDTLKSDDMSLETCYFLKNIAKTHRVANWDRFNKVLDGYLAEHFVEAAARDEFNDLLEEDVASILTSKHLRCHMETVKWESLLKWVKHEKCRGKSLQNLMTMISFERIPVKYIRKKIRSEPLVNKSEKCKDILLDAALGACASKVSSQENSGKSTVVILDHKSGFLTALDMENGYHTRIETLRKVKKTDLGGIISVRDELYLLKNRKLFRYSSTGSWEERASKPLYSHWPGHSVAFRDKMYVIQESAMHCYDPSENTWEEDLPGCGIDDDFSVAASHDFIYAVGDSYRVRSFDPEARTWFDITTTHDIRVCMAAAFVYRGQLYVTGGYNHYHANSSVVRLNQSDDSWTYLKSMNRDRAGHCALVFDDKLYVLGGDYDGNGNKPDEKSVEVFDEDSTDWKIVQKLPRLEGTISACVIKSSILKQ